MIHKIPEQALISATAFYKNMMITQQRYHDFTEGLARGMNLDPSKVKLDFKQGAIVDLDDEEMKAPENTIPLTPEKEKE